MAYFAKNSTASAAGLLSHIQSATYSVTKHAAVAFAEWVSIKYRDQGVRVVLLTGFRQSPASPAVVDERPKQLR